MTVRLVHVRGYSDNLDHDQATIFAELNKACLQHEVVFSSDPIEYDDFIELLRGNESRTLIYFYGRGSVENGILLQKDVWVSGDVIRANKGNNVCVLLHCSFSVKIATENPGDVEDLRRMVKKLLQYSGIYEENVSSEAIMSLINNEHVTMGRGTYLDLTRIIVDQILKFGLDSISMHYNGIIPLFIGQFPIANDNLHLNVLQPLFELIGSLRTCINEH